MRKIAVILFVSISLITCKSTGVQDGFKSITYSSEFQTASVNNPFERRNYEMSIPKGFTVDKEDYNPEFKEIVYTYEDSAKIYISDNALSGSSLNGDNKLRQGITSIKRENLNDSIYMEGLQDNGKYWKENILNDIVVGYVNVPESRKNEFDVAISSIVRK